MPGKESGAGRVTAPDLYRVNGSLPISNHTIVGVGVQNGQKSSRSEDRFGTSCDIVEKTSHRVSTFLRVMRHVVIAGTFTLLNFDRLGQVI